MNKEYYSKKITSPIGPLTLVASDKALAAILWGKDQNFDPGKEGTLKENSSHSLIKRTETQLKEYFAGKRTSFDIPLDPKGTDFQRSVWKQLKKIPHGKTRSYAQIAEHVGGAHKCRAVGGANGRNPIPIIVPCHRVIGADGSLTGFGGGLQTKQFLLDLEAGR